MKKTLALVLGCMLMGGMFAGCDDNYDDDIQAYCDKKAECDKTVKADTCVTETKNEMTVCKSEQAAALRCLTEKTCTEFSSDSVCTKEAKALLECATKNAKDAIEETEE